MDKPVSCRITGFHPAGGVMVLPAVCTITKATRTSPLLVPAGSPRVREEPPTLLLPGAVDRSEIPPPGGGVGVAVGAGVGVGVGAGVGVAVGVGVGVGAGAGVKAIRIVTLAVAPLSVP